MTKIGLGHGNDPNAFNAGKSIAESAMRNGTLSRADLVVAFCAGPLDHEAFLNGVRTKVGPEVPVIGGSTIGVITNEYLSYSGFPAALAIIQSDDKAAP